MFFFTGMSWIFRPGWDPPYINTEVSRWEKSPMETTSQKKNCCIMLHPPIFDGVRSATCAERSNWQTSGEFFTGQQWRRPVEEVLAWVCLKILDEPQVVRFFQGKIKVSNNKLLLPLVLAIFPAFAVPGWLDASDAWSPFHVKRKHLLLFSPNNSGPKIRDVPIFFG